MLMLCIPLQPRRVALLLPVGIFVFKNAEEGEGPPK
jgi:hypothetical protein